MAKVTIKSRIRYFYPDIGIVECEVFYHISGETDLTSSIEAMKYYILYCDGVILINRNYIRELNEDGITLVDNTHVDLTSNKVTITGLNFRIWFLDSFKYAVEQLNKAGVMLTIEEKACE